MLMAQGSWLMAKKKGRGDSGLGLEKPIMGVRFCGVKKKTTTNHFGNAVQTNCDAEMYNLQQASFSRKPLAARPKHANSYLLLIFICITSPARNLKPTRQMVQMVLGFSCGPIGSKWILMDSVDS